MELINTKTMFTIIAFLIAMPLSAAQEKEKNYVLQNQALKISFSSSAFGFDCTSIENKLVANTRFIVPKDNDLSLPGLWTITMSCLLDTGKRETIQLDNKNSSGNKTAKTENDDKLVLQWKGISLPDDSNRLDVTATIVLAQGEEPSIWYIQVENHSKKWCVDSVCYPVLRTICKPGTADVLLPYGAYGGTLRKNNTSTFDDWYPSGSPYCAFQFMAFNQGDSGLYIGAHDGGENFKKLKLTSEQHVTFELYAENMGMAASGRVPSFPYVIAAYRGDWWNAAKIYRQWALQQKWSRKGWLATREDMSTKKFLDIGFWFHGNASTKELLSSQVLRSDMIVARKLFAPLKLALHLYDWHQIQFDSEYPEFFPAKEGVIDDIKALESEGTSVMPYTNALLYDIGLASFEQARPFTVKKQNGILLSGPASAPGRELAEMCTYTEFWQQKMTDICNQAITELGVTGIYLDQLGGHHAQLCFDTSHGHSLGGGGFWTEGYRKMLDSVTKITGPNGIYLTSEMFAENYIDYIDGFLVAHLPLNIHDVPLAQAVYSGYTSCFGCYESERDEIDTFSMLQGEAFIWGIMPGWLKTPLVRQQEKAELAKKLALYRMAAKDFLIYGELLNEVHIEPKAGNVKRTVYGPYMAVTTHIEEFRPVMGSIWRTYDKKSLGIVVMNMDSQPHKVKFSVNIEQWLKKDAAKEWGVYRILPEGSIFEKLAKSHLLERDIILDSHEVLLLAIRPVEGIATVKLVDPVRMENVSNQAAVMAESFLFDQEMTKQKLNIYLEKDIVDALFASSIEAIINIVNDGKDIQKLQIIWPDNNTEEVVLSHNQSTTLKHNISFAENKAMYTKCEIGIKKGVFAKKIPLYVNLIAPLQIAIDIGQSIESNQISSLKIAVQNNTEKIQSGKVVMVLPEDWEYISGGNFKDIKPGHKVDIIVKCKVPYYANNDIAVITAKIDEYTVAQRVTAIKSRPQAISRFFKLPPVIDGNLGDWSKMTPTITLDGTQKTQVQISNYKGAEDLSATLYTGWDNKNFYFAAVVTDDIFLQKNLNELIWDGDCIQFAFHFSGKSDIAQITDYSGFGKPDAAKNDGGASIGAALTEVGAIIWQWSPNLQKCKMATLSVICNKDEKTTIYEGQIPWKEIGIKNINMPITWSLTINDRDGEDEAFGWMEWTPGICGTQDPLSFGWLRLQK
ncbi:MAG: hypothetical protein A2Y12_04350 [Planctomycetes bacterium GWF2_42_9]|nr:MAG: hypothetical protein A2Y12_04350 [Planctomycetes bacterium GWF2_42_9]